MKKWNTLTDRVIGNTVAWVIAHSLFGTVIRVERSRGVIVVQCQILQRTLLQMKSKLLQIVTKDNN